MTEPKYKKCKHCGETCIDNFYPSKFNICKQCHRDKQNRKQELKPHLCKTCGETNPKKFGGSRKSQCNNCFNKAQRKREANLINAKKMTKDEETNFNENVKSYLSEESRLRWEVHYG